MRLAFAIFALFMGLGYGQTGVPGQPRYSATTGNVVLAAAGTTFTIQQPATGARAILLESAMVSCSVACNITQAFNGTPATATAGTVTPLPPISIPSSATVWTASNVGGGTAAGGIVPLTAAGTVVLDLSRVVIPAGSTAANYSVIISSITGTANITYIFSQAVQ